MFAILLTVGAYPGLCPAPHFAARGMKWVQHYAAPGLATAVLQDYIATSHTLAARSLTRKLQHELGLVFTPRPPGP